MKKLIAFLTIICLVIGASFGQNSTVETDVDKAVRSDFNQYLDALLAKEFDKSMDYMLPEFFDIFPRKQMVKILEQTFNNPDIELELTTPIILSVGNTMKVESKSYLRLRYSNIMNMRLVSEEVETPDEKEMRISLLKLSFGESFGLENVSYNEKTDFFQIYAEKDVIAISKNGLTDWKFVVIEKQQMFILEKLLPEEVINMK